MKNNLLLLACLLLIATSCATQKSSPQTERGAVQPLVYYDGNDKPAAMGIFRYSDEQ